jgi:hypothetical protein
VLLSAKSVLPDRILLLDTFFQVRAIRRLRRRRRCRLVDIQIKSFNH